ncbi:MAG: GDP-mannose 4,6-dehydratase [Oligoflexales bacterium]|nr:GDP-mannose 4,6-dehydratase [Oligoflexales bacterium]
MKAIVTGGCGFIGSHMVDLLIKHDIETVVIDNITTGRLENLDHHMGEPLLKIIRADIAEDSFDISSLVADVDYVFHFAALADIVPSVQQPAEYSPVRAPQWVGLLMCVDIPVPAAWHQWMDG